MSWLSYRSPNLRVANSQVDLDSIIAKQAVSAGVATIAGQNGTVLLASTDGSVSFDTTTAGTIDIQASLAVDYVESVAGQTGTVLLASTDGSVTFDTLTTPGTIDIQATPVVSGVTSIAAMSGAITLSSSDGTITIVPGGGDINLICPTAASASSAAIAAGLAAAAAQGTADTALANAATADGKAVAAQGTADTALANAATADSKAVSALSYNLTGTTIAGVISGWPIGSGNPLPQNTWSVIATITFNIPPEYALGDCVYYDGWFLADFQANFNSYGGITYSTNTNPTETDLIGSSTTTANALNFSNIQQIYFPVNLIFPPTHLTAGGNITIRTYINPTSSNHYITATPQIMARVGLTKD